MEDRSKRVSRVERELLETLSHALLHELNAPLPGYASITAVEASPDLRSAKVYFRLVGDKKTTDETEKVLTNYRNIFQQHVVKNLKMRYSPVLRFEFGTVPKTDEIDALLENLRRPKRLVE